MGSKETLYRYLHLALIDIRHEANKIESVKVAALSDLFHNLPSALGAEQVNYDQLLNELKERAESQKGLSEWLKNNTPL